MKRANVKAGWLRHLLSGLEPEEWKVGVEEHTEEFFLDRSKAGVYSFANRAGRKVMDFIVKAKNDLPEILEYLQALESGVEELRKEVEALEDELYDLRLDSIVG